MQNHFNKLNTPLLSLPVYSSLRSQAHRFLDAGYAEIETCDLNTFFYGVMDAEQRKTALTLELFDEFEELGAFLTHYFILAARNEGITLQLKPRGDDWQYIDWKNDTLLNGNIVTSQDCHADRDTGLSLQSLDGVKPPQRRFSAVAPQQNGILIQGGLSSTTRQSSSFTLTHSPHPNEFVSSVQPSARMCHTLTGISDGRAILVGGREAPGTALDDTWLWHDQWKKLAKIPGGGLYRHTAAHVRADVVLVFGGRRNGGTVSSAWYLFSVEHGWKELKCGDPCPRLWGASLGWESDCGVLTGGLDEFGNCSGDVYSVRLYWETLTISLKRWSISPDIRSVTRRYGAKIVNWAADDYLLIGGMGSHRSIPLSEQFILLSSKNSSRIMTVQTSADKEPWLVGHDVALQNGSVIIFGGGGVCFSFGSFWNDNVFQLYRQKMVQLENWKLFEVSSQGSIKKSLTNVKCESQPIRRVRIEDPSQWTQILQASEVCVIEGLNFGPCITKWTPGYLKTAVGEDKEIVIHSIDAGAMNFLSKNFRYKPLRFGEFIDMVFGDSKMKVYLRALSGDSKNKPARLEDDFPGLAADYKIPETLCGDSGIPTERIFSTILRIGGPGTSMWLHYDVFPST